MAATKDLENQVILVDEKDCPLGTTTKLHAHQQGLLHRAFSIFIFKQETTLELLLQQRAAVKYHSPSLWTNTCCSHPLPHETILAAAQRRLQEEFHLNIALQHAGQFHYTARFDNGLIENELDHVFTGFYSNETITPNPAEIQAFRWISIEALKQEMHQYPNQFTPWLNQALTLALASAYTGN